MSNDNISGESEENKISGLFRCWENCLIVIQGDVHCEKRFCQRSFSRVPECQRSSQRKVCEPFLIILLIYERKAGKIEVVPAQKNDLFLGGE